MKNLYDIDDDDEADLEVEHNAILNKITEGYTGAKGDSQDITASLLAGKYVYLNIITSIWWKNKLYIMDYVYSEQYEIHMWLYANARNK